MDAVKEAHAEKPQPRIRIKQRQRQRAAVEKRAVCVGIE
jgi:hypothetical protein